MADLSQQRDFARTALVLVGLWAFIVTASWIGALLDLRDYKRTLSDTRLCATTADDQSEFRACVKEAER